jgi:glycosyltransferase involved in cell wall biosynthesis
MSIVLSVLPLSEVFRRTLQARLEGEVDFMPLAKVKTGGAVAALRFLVRQRTDAVYATFEEPQEMIMMPIIVLLAQLIRARRRFIVRPDQSIAALTMADVARACFSVVAGSVAAVKSGIVAAVELSMLERKRNAPPPAKPSSRIVYLNTNVNLGVKAGGSLGHVAGVVNDLHRRGYDLTYAATRRFSVIDPAIPMQTLTLPRLLGVPMDLFIFGFSQQIYRQLNGMFGNGADAVVYQRMSRSDYTGAKLSRVKKVPLIMEYNGSEAWGARHWGHPMLFERLARRAELVSLRSAHTVVTISDVLADELVAIGIPRSRVVVYPNCVDSSVFDPSRFSREATEALREKHGIPTDAIVFGFIGTFGKWHGVDVLCAVIRRLVEERREWLDRKKVRFLIVGDGFLGRYVAELVEDERMRRYVSWPGLVEQREGPAYLAAMDALLSPHIPNADGSRFFGSPTKLFEYMSMARPIIASRLDQIATVLSPGLPADALPSGAPDADARELAVLTEPGSVPELMDAITFIVDHPEWREVLARNARREVMAKYQWSEHVARIIHGAGILADPPEARA